MEASAEIESIVRRLDLQPHPEGGFYREVWRSPLDLPHPRLAEQPQRSASTSIYFLLPAETFSAWHRVRASDEVWHLYSGGPLELHVIDQRGHHQTLLLSADLEVGQPQAVVPAGYWQAARAACGAAYALCGCTVAPGFDFADFEMPSRNELLANFPQHVQVIRQFTRAGA